MAATKSFDKMMDNKIIFSASVGLPETRQQPQTLSIILLSIILSQNSPCLIFSKVWKNSFQPLEKCATAERSAVVDPDQFNKRRIYAFSRH
jgi:hypothetical protein